jgi:hypothetical protein
VVMLGSQPIQLTQKNNRRRRHSRASAPKWEIEDVASNPSALAALSYGEAERLKGGSRDPRWRDRIAHELGRARYWETGGRKLEKDAEGRGRGEGRYSWLSRKQRGSCSYALPN